MNVRIIPPQQFQRWTRISHFRSEPLVRRRSHIHTKSSKDEGNAIAVRTVDLFLLVAVAVFAFARGDKNRK